MPCEKLPSNRVLSVRQPFAQLLLTPGSHPEIAQKWCENRTWAVYNLPASKLKEDRGCPRILIHAADRVDREAMEDLDLSEAGPTSVILGSVRLLKVINVGKLLQEYEVAGDGFEYEEEAIALFLEAHKSVSGTWLNAGHLEDGAQYVNIPEEDGPWFWWFFDKPILLKKPIPCKGKTSLWKYDVSQTVKK